MGYPETLKSMQSIGYRHMINFIEGKWTWDQTLELMARDTRHYAKRQFTWFNNDPDIVWHDVSKTDNIFLEINNFLLKNSPKN
jgi:tRNA dimethylallyltransferase